MARLPLEINITLGPCSNYSGHGLNNRAVQVSNVNGSIIKRAIIRILTVQIILSMSKNLEGWIFMNDKMLLFYLYSILVMFFVKITLLK